MQFDPHISSSVKDSALAAALRDRHSDTLRGALAPLDSFSVGDVEIFVGDDASTLAGQHLCFWSANLLGRLEGVVERVRIRVDTPEGKRDVPLMAGVDPRNPGGGQSLVAAIEAAAGLAAPHRIRLGQSQIESPSKAVEGVAYSRICLHVGSVSSERSDPPKEDTTHVYVAAGDWTAHVGRKQGPGCDPLATLSLGPHAAAALGVGEIFRILRATGELAEGPEHLTLSTWSCGLIASGQNDAPSRSAISTSLEDGIPHFVLVGVGAVGSAFLGTLWASGVHVPEADIVDGDAVSLTNLNRYPVFGVKDVRHPKASGAASLLHRVEGGGRTAFKLRGFDMWWADYRKQSPQQTALLVSAVDTNAARHQMQDTLPQVILGASTHELRAELDRYDLSDTESRCLKCGNPISVGETDAELRARLLELDNNELDREAEDRGLDPELLRRYVKDLRAGRNGCAILSGAALDKLRHGAAEGAFAVSFVSALAGTLLAAQVVREATRIGSALTAPASRAHIQLWRPAAAVNGPRRASAEAACWCSRTDVRAAYDEMWSDNS
jgi:hypothetical protein